MNADQKSSALLRNLFKGLDAWATEKVGHNYNPLGGALAAYTHWDELSLAFISFLKEKSLDDWTQEDNALVQSIVRVDWAYHRLLLSLSDPELCELITMPFSDEVVRMYMLVRGSQINDETVRKKIALHFFENDPSDTIRDSAFKVLARCGWHLTETYAERFWESGDLLKQMVALDALHAANSDLLDKYLDMAAKSEDGNLKTAAMGISKLRSI